MGAEEKLPQQNGVATLKENGVPDPVEPPAEEPPKIEEIITPEILEQIITGYNSNLSLKSWKAEIGSKIGDNYMSILYSVELDLEDETSNGFTEKLHVMLKMLPSNAGQADWVNEMKLFPREFEIYTKVFPMFIAIQKDRGIPSESLYHPWPKCYAAHVDGKADFLAMENLKALGYKMGNRVIGLDFNHCSIALRSLAKYHAISYVKYEGNRDKILEAFPMTKVGMFDKESKVWEVQAQYYTQSFKNLAKSLEETGEALAASRLEKLANADHGIVIGDLTTENIENAVITHGDFWVNNLLFRYHDKDAMTTYPVDVMLIDFQACQATSRMVEFYYFLMVSSKMDVLNARENDLLMIYYSEFTSYAQRLGMNTKEKGLTWENLLKEADQYRLYGVWLGMMLAPMFSADSADIPVVDGFAQEDCNNSNEPIKKSFKDLSNRHVLEKVKCLALDHLPRCHNAAAFL